jgi:hypothetical protein
LIAQGFLDCGSFYINTNKVLAAAEQIAYNVLLSRPMNFRPVALVLTVTLLASCAYQGVVVDKSARDLPFSETVGMPGSFALMLRDNSGAVHRQLVTPDVFARYEVGDYFNDMQAGPAARQQGSGDKVMLTASNPPRPSTVRVAKAHSATRSHAIASKKHHKTHRAIASATRTRSHKSKAAAAKRHVTRRAVAALAPAPIATPLKDDDFRIVRVARVR